MRVFFVLLLFVSTPAMAQTISQHALVSAAGEGGDADMQVSYTIGETVVETLFSASVMLTPGFQQDGRIILDIDDPSPLVPESMQIFPNPARNQVSVSISGGGQVTVRLIDLLGRIHASKDLQRGAPSRTVRVNTSTLPTGIYLLQISGKNGESSHSRVLHVLH